MRALSVAALAALTSLLTACTARISGEGAAAGLPGAGAGGVSPPGSTPQAGAAACTTRPALGSDLLRLLTKREYEATLRETFGSSVFDAVAVELAQLPDKRVAHGFRSMAKGTTGAEVEGYYLVGAAAAAYVTASAERLAALAPCLGEAAIDDACAKRFIEAFGQKLYRRPLAADELASLTALYADGAAITPADGVRYVLFSLLQAPPFLYRVEIAGTPRADNSSIVDLTGYEVATRLSYLAWGSPPDDLLLAAAAQGKLATQAGVAGELDRLLSDQRASARLGQFFSEWLETEELPSINQSQEYLAGIAADGLSSAMQEELHRFTDSLGFQGGGTFRDLFTSNSSFVSSPELAKIYGVEPGTGSDARVELGSDRRAGILTRAAVLLSTGEATSPIRRGAFVRRKLLCDPIPPPDPNAFPPGSIEPPAFNPDMTNRERWTAKTATGVCAGCHANLNPFGFALENFDNIGRYRTSEPIVDPATGMKVNDLTIDAEVDVVLDGAGPVHASGAAGLGAALAESATAQACFARQWFRFVNGREATDEDACVLSDVVQAVAGGQSLRDALERIALAPEFRMRRIDAQ